MNERTAPRGKASGNSNIGDIDARRREFKWNRARQEAGLPEGGPFNIGWLCTDRICESGSGEKTALIWQSSTDEIKRFSFDDLRRYSNAYGRYFTDLGLDPGDRVAVFMDRTPDLYIGFLGGLKAGLVMQPLFSAFGEEALEQRLRNAGTRAILTSRKLAFRIRKIRDKCPALEHVIIIEPGDLQMKEGEQAFGIADAEPLDSFTCYEAKEETPSILHYTSGTTGQPKGALHTHGSLPAQALTTKWVLDLKKDDLYWCTADPGWVTGTSYGILGPWSLGVTQLVLDGGFTVNRWYEAIQNHGVTVWYSAPTAIRMLMKEGIEGAGQFDLSSLRHLASVGEPLNPEAVIWSQEAYGRPFHDTWWQTETGAMMVTNLPGMEIRPGSMGKPFPGITAAVLDEANKPIDEPNKPGQLAVRPPWPSIFRAYWEREEAYKSKFVNGWYLTGDQACIDEDGYFWFMGRDDDVINTGGHLVGPFEIESALLGHEAVAESAAIGKPDKVNMEVVKAFVALKAGFEPNRKLEMSIMNFIRKKLSPLAMPQEIEFVDKLPKTRSGKIMRRLLRAKEWGEEVGDTSTLEDD